MQNSVICTRISSLYGFQPSSEVLCMQNCDFMTRYTSLYGSQTSSVVLSSHNSVLSTRINRLYWFQLSPVVFCIHNSGFRPKPLLVQDPTCGFCIENSDFWTRITSLYVPRHVLSFCACTTVCLASEFLVSIGPSPHLLFLLANQRLFDQTYKSVRVPDLTCHFVHAKQRA